MGRTPGEAGAAGRRYSFTARATVMRGARREKPTATSLRGFSVRCQYCASAAGRGSSTPAVYTACQMPARFTRRVISCGRGEGEEVVWEGVCTGMCALAAGRPLAVVRERLTRG